MQTQLKLLSGDHRQQNIDDQVTPIQVLKKYPDIARMLWSFLFLNLVFSPILVMMPWYVEKYIKGTLVHLQLLKVQWG